MSKVSLCTITRNRPALLKLLAECVLAQEHPRQMLEWVIVDDSDSDPAAPDLSAVRQAGIAVQHLRLAERLPLGAKRNLCHERAGGDLLVLIDDDDYYPPSRVPEAVAVLTAGEGEVAGCPRMPLLLLPEGSHWLTPSFHVNDATANSLAYRRSYVEAGHRFDPEAWQAEEVAFLEEFATPLLRLDPARTLTCIGHGSNTVDKRLWIARNGEHRFERLPADAPGFPPADWLGRYCRALGLPEPAPALAVAEPSPKALAAPDPHPWKVAVITPYCTEPLELLRRCHDSVLAQEVACTHFFVADGAGHPELAGWDCRPIALGACHGDNGNTPRSLGALAAMNEGFDCIAFLDADNWWAPDHLRRAIDTQASGGYEVVFSGRHIVFPDGRRLTQLPEEERSHRHADTSAMVLFAPAFSSLALWAQMPRLYAPLCDRVVFQQLMARHRCGWSGAPTLFFETWYAGHFLAAGLLPPRNAKFLPLQPAAAWEQAAEAFRRRCPTPVYAGGEGIGPDKPRINLVTILAPARSGGTLLQGLLCRHLGFEGIPENHFLFQCIERLGPDVQARHDGERLRQLLREPAPQASRVKAFDARPRGLEQALRPDRSYTLLEAYFRALQALTPPEAMAFARSYGQVSVLDRSCTLPLVADVLFQCLPEQRALLLLRDPLEQIASVRRMMELHPHAWGCPDFSLDALCRLYLQSLAIPLQAAPPGQLRLLSHERLLARPQEEIEAVCSWLGLEPNAFFALEPLETGPPPWINRVHEEAWRREIEALPGRLLHEEPWKEGCVAGVLELPDPGEKTPIVGEDSSGAGGRLSGPERESLGHLFAPLRALIQTIAAGESPLQLRDPVPGVSSGLSPAHAFAPDLPELVEQVVEALLRHGANAPLRRD